jgi:hypothetical protein
MTTELSNLPSDPSVPNSGNSIAPQIPENIKLETQAYQNDLDVKPSAPPMADTKQMNSMVTEIQNAAKQGLTRLAEDIPQQTSQVVQDPQSLPNAIPEEPKTTHIDYIQNTATQEEIVNELKKQTNKQTSIEIILEELKLPLLIAIVYYMFQTKTFKTLILSKIPSLLNEMGGYTTNGFLFVSCLYGIIIYGLLKVAKYLEL